MRTTVGALACWALVAAGFAACGGSSQQGASQLPVSSATAESGKPPTNVSGVQVGISDTPSSSNVPVSERPKMNDAARVPYMRALEAFGRGDLDTAKTFFQEAINKDPKAYQAFYSLGVILDRLRDPAALTQFRQAFSIVPDYEPAIVSYGLSLARRGNVSEADQFLTERHAKMPKSAAVATGLAEIKSMQRDTGSAQQLAQEALKLNPNYAPSMVALARDHYRNRRLDLAQYALQAILDGFDADNPARDKENVEARLIRALIYREEGRRAAAIKEFEQVLTVRPDLVDASVQLATYYLQAGNADKALPLLDRALKYDNSNLIAHMNRGDCYRLMSKLTEAKKEFDWVLSKDSSMAQVHYDLGLLYLFAPSFPGMTPVAQADAAIAEFEKYQQMRGRGAAGQGSDTEELINRAKARKGVAEANAAPSQPAPGPAGSGAPLSQSPAPASSKSTSPGASSPSSKPAPAASSASAASSAAAAPVSKPAASSSAHAGK